MSWKMGSIIYAVFFISLVLSLVITPYVIKLATRLKVMDQPEQRKIHKKPVPRWGGLGIFISFTAAVVLCWLIFPYFRHLAHFTTSKFSMSSQIIGILVGGAILIIIGTIDDKYGLPAIAKLFGQILVVLVLINYGIKISGFAVPFFDFLPFNSILITQLVTVSWFLLFINSVNFSDGMDGLACGIVAISSFTFLAISILMWGTQKILVIQNLKLAAILSAALAGSCIGFLRYNFFPAKIFMGDTGSMFLGYMLAVITTIGTLKTTAVIALFIPMLALGLPLIDISITVFRRWHNKAPLFTSDRQHLHHRLLGKGWTQREVVLLSYVLSGILGIFAILLTIYKGVPK